MNEAKLKNSIVGTVLRIIRLSSPRKLKTIFIPLIILVRQKQLLKGI